MIQGVRAAARQPGGSPRTACHTCGRPSRATEQTLQTRARSESRPSPAPGRISTFQAFQQIRKGLAEVQGAQVKEGWKIDARAVVVFEQAPAEQAAEPAARQRRVQRRQRTQVARVWLHEAANAAGQGLGRLAGPDDPPPRSSRSASSGSAGAAVSALASSMPAEAKGVRRRPTGPTEAEGNG